MTISSDEAGAMIAEVESIVAKVKQSRIYGIAGEMFMLWGVVVVAGQILLALLPHGRGWGWILVDAAGVAASFLWLRRRLSASARLPLRFVAAFALFFGFGWIWSHVIADFTSRQEQAFWPTLFMFGYALAGLWFGAAFAVIGLGLTGLMLVGYFGSGDWFPLWLAAIEGGGLLLCGYWMRRP